MNYQHRRCAECGADYAPSSGNQRRCSDCGPGSCTGCGTALKDKRSPRCEQCRLADNPRAVQCPYRWCLRHYVPDGRHPHKCGRGPTDDDRLALVEAEAALVVIDGPPLPPNALGVVDRRR